MSGRRQQIMLKPEVLRWARKRVDYQTAELADKVGVEPGQVKEWEKTGKISIAQINKLAHKTYTPLGLLYLSEPPEDLDKLPIPDFRSGDSHLRQHPSPNLLETVHTMQRRQAWMREELLQDGVEPISFVGSARVGSARVGSARVGSARVGSARLGKNHDAVATAMKKHLGLAKNWAAQEPTWEDALRHLRNIVEEAGILIMFNGVVGNNTHRKLDREEFQGFALVDDYAPLIFVNGADYRAAQMFTLSHELAHIFVGEAGVSKFKQLRQTENVTEKFCDQVAAEFLVPSEDLQVLLRDASNLTEQYGEVSGHFKVSTIVAARRMLDVGLINLDDFFAFYKRWKRKEIAEQNKGGSGGNFWNTQNVRIGHPFGAAIGRAVGEGRLFYREAYHLTGLKGKTFDKFMSKVSG